MINSYTHVWTGTGWLTSIPLALNLMHFSRQVFGFYMNTCWAPHQEVNPERFTVATTALLSLRQRSNRMRLWMSDCSFTQRFTVATTALLFLRQRSNHMRLWMNDCSFTQRVLNIHWSCYSAVWLLHGWCHVKPLPSRRKFCVHHTTMH